MTPQRVLVVGGAGYIGSHVVLALQDQGHFAVALDNLSTGFAEAVSCDLVIADALSGRRVKEAIQHYRIDTVMHLAASTQVAESVDDPTQYYFNNTEVTRSLLVSCKLAGVRNFVFSSTAAVYGESISKQHSEKSAPRPENPYGRSKLASEWVIQDYAKATGLNCVILRYFNVCGADSMMRAGPRGESTTLVKRVAEVAAGKRDCLQIYGATHKTPDGTTVRDYVHVSDIADAHLAAMRYLRINADSNLFNIGYGYGYSVLDVVRAFERHIGHGLPIEFLPPRAGDVAESIASVKKAYRYLGWGRKHYTLADIVSTAYEWERKTLAM